jgi:hypothetical protein
MELRSLLKKEKAVILKKWLAAIFDTYPAGTANFIQGEGDMFANPVGYTISYGAGQLLDGLIRGEDPRALQGCLEKIIRIRAVQDFTPSQAVGFMIDLKTVIRGEAIGGVTKYGLLDELDALEMKIDRLASLSVEQYASIKDQIRELAAKESLKADEFQARVISIRRVG